MADVTAIIREAQDLADRKGAHLARIELAARGYKTEWLDRYVPLPAACWRAEDFGLDLPMLYSGS